MKVNTSNDLRQYLSRLLLRIIELHNNNKKRKKKKRVRCSRFYFSLNYDNYDMSFISGNFGLSLLSSQVLTEISCPLFLDNAPIHYALLYVGVSGKFVQTAVLRACATRSLLCIIYRNVSELSSFTDIHC